MPTSYDADHEQGRFERGEHRRNGIFKVVEIVLWFLLVIIVVSCLLILCIANNYIL